MCHSSLFTHFKTCFFLLWQLTANWINYCQIQHNLYSKNTLQLNGIWLRVHTPLKWRYQTPQEFWPIQLWGSELCPSNSRTLTKNHLPLEISYFHPPNEVPVHENLHSVYMNRCKAVRVTVDMKNKNCVFSTYAFLFLLSTGNDQPDQQVKTSTSLIICRQKNIKELVYHLFFPGMTSTAGHPNSEYRAHFFLKTKSFL